MTAALEISGLSKTYPNGVQALDDVSLTIRPGMFGLLGPNGAGKSTLMRTLATLQDADAGSARLGHVDVLRDKDAVRRMLGYLPQDFGVYPKVSAEELLDHLARLKGLDDKATRRDVVATLLKQTNLYDVRKKALGGFSGGMRQRFGIAQALLGDPKLIIVDEPTAGLDPEERVRFHNLLADIGESVIVILSTHIVSDVSDLCADMAIINKGRVLLTGQPQSLTAAARRPRLAEGDIAQRSGRGEDATAGDLDAAGVRPHAGERRQRRRARARASCRSRPRWRTSTSRPSPAGSTRRSPRRGGLMRNALTIAGFEIATRLKRISTWVYFAVFLAIAMFWTAAAGGVIKSAVGFLRQRQGVDQLAVRHRADGLVPRHVRAVDHRRDHGPRRAAGFRVPRRAFLLQRADQEMGIPVRPLRRRGRRAARHPVEHRAWAACSVSCCPDSTPTASDPCGRWPTSCRISRSLLPNLLVLGGLFFCLAALTRRMLPVYIGSVLLLIGFLAAQGLLRDMANKTLASLLDPFGVVATSQLTAYWSISERNTRLVPLEGFLLWNRLLWLAIGAAVIGITTWRFRMAQAGTTGRRRAAATEDTAGDVVTVQLRRVAPEPVSGARLLPRLVWLNFRETVKNVYFGVIAFAGVLFLDRDQLDRRRHLRHQYLAGDLADAGSAVGDVLRVHAGDHHVLRGRTRVARARAPAGPDPRRAADPDVAAVPGQAAGADAGAGGAAGVADAVRSRHPDGQGLSPLRARAVLQGPVRHRADRLLAGLRAGDDRAFAGEPEVPRSFHHDRLLHRDQLREPDGLRAQPVQVRRHAAVRVLGHERLRPLPAPRARVPGVLGGARRCCSPSPPICSGCAAPRPAGAAASRIARRRFTRPVAALSGVAAVAMAGFGGVHLLQHQRPQPLPDRRRPAGAAGRLREEVQESCRRPAAEDHRGQARRRPLPPRAEGPDARAATRWSTRPPRRSTPCTCCSRRASRWS